MPPNMKGMPRPKATGGPDVHAPSSNTVSNFRGGEQVCLVGIKSQPALNGRCAFVGALDEASHRFDVWVTPLCISFAGGGLKMNWVDLQTDEAAPAVRVKPSNMQILNLTNSFGEDEREFEQLAPQHKAAVLRAQKSLWDESTMFKDGRRRPPNVVGLFSEQHRPSKVQLVSKPQGGVVPRDLAAGGARTVVVRRALVPELEGIDGFIYVVASCPKIRMSYRQGVDADGPALEGKAAADAYLSAGKV